MGQDLGQGLDCVIYLNCCACRKQHFPVPVQERRQSQHQQAVYVIYILDTMTWALQDLGLELGLEIGTRVRVDLGLGLC